VADALMMIVATAIAAGVALLIGWLAWARPSAVHRAERDAARHDAATQREEASRQREERGRHAVEVEMLQKRLGELGRAEAGRMELAARVAALDAEREERDRAHAADIARTEERFVALAAQALDGAQAKLLEGADGLLTRHREAAGAGLAENRAQLSELIAPMRETLGKYEAQLGEIEKVRAESYGQLTQLLDSVAKGQDRVSGATAKLETVLRSSGKAAGRWGEEQCRNVLELAGLVDGIDFVAQTSDGSDDNRRPDFIVTLPGDRKLVIDVKCSLDSYMSAVGCDGDEERTRLLTSHAKAVRAHATGLASKAYEKSVGGAVDFVVLFVPGENFLAAAFEHDRGLMHDFMAKRLVLAGPINLIAVARTVAAMRDQARLAKQAAEIARLGRDLYDSIRIMGGNIAAVQKGLEGAVTNWNKLVGQLDSRVVSRARKFEALGATTGLDTIAEVRSIEAMPLLPTAPELLAAANS
jgi:DNA recombination protein RmuC